MDVARHNGFTDNTTAVVIDPARQQPGPDTLAVLARDALFSRLEPMVLRHIAPYLDRPVFAPGECLMQEGASDGALYLWASGELERSRNGRVWTSGPGPGRLGALSLLRDGRAGETVTARTRTRALRLRPDALRAMIERQPELAAQLSLALARELAHQVVDLSEACPEEAEE